MESGWGKRLLSGPMREWSDRAIARTTPALLGLFSLVQLLAHDLWCAGAVLPCRPSASGTANHSRPSSMPWPSSPSIFSLGAHDFSDITCGC